MSKWIPITNELVFKDYIRTLDPFDIFLTLGDIDKRKLKGEGFVSAYWTGSKIIIRSATSKSNVHVDTIQQMTERLMEEYLSIEAAS